MGWVVMWLFTALDPGTRLVNTFTVAGGGAGADSAAADYLLIPACDQDHGEESGSQSNAYAAIRNLVTGASRRTGFANIAHACRYYGGHDERISRSMNMCNKTSGTPDRLTQHAGAVDSTPSSASQAKAG